MNDSQQIYRETHGWWYYSTKHVIYNKQQASWKEMKESHLMTPGHSESDGCRNSESQTPSDRLD